MPFTQTLHEGYVRYWVSPKKKQTHTQKKQSSALMKTQCPGPETQWPWLAVRVGGETGQSITSLKGHLHLELQDLLYPSCGFQNLGLSILHQMLEEGLLLTSFARGELIMQTACLLLRRTNANHPPRLLFGAREWESAGELRILPCAYLKTHINYSAESCNKHLCPFNYFYKVDL